MIKAAKSGLESKTNIISTIAPVTTRTISQATTTKAAIRTFAPVTTKTAFVSTTTKSSQAIRTTTLTGQNKKCANGDGYCKLIFRC